MAVEVTQISGASGACDPRRVVRCGWNQQLELWLRLGCIVWRVVFVSEVSSVGCAGVGASDSTYGGSDQSDLRLLVRCGSHLWR